MSIDSLTPSYPRVPPTSAVVPSVEMLQLGRSVVPLREQAQSAGKLLAAGLRCAGDAVATGRLEAAALDFAREVRALHIGSPDVALANREHMINAALAVGQERAAALSSVGLNAVDRAAATLDIAAQTLGETLAPALYHLPSHAGA